MTFSEAIEAIKNGEKVARAGWNGKDMYIFLVDGEKLRDAIGENYSENICVPDYNECILLPTIAMRTHDSTGREAILLGWLASQSDMLSDDWYLVTFTGVE